MPILINIWYDFFTGNNKIYKEHWLLWGRWITSLIRRKFKINFVTMKKWKISDFICINFPSSAGCHQSWIHVHCNKVHQQLTVCYGLICPILKKLSSFFFKLQKFSHLPLHISSRSNYLTSWFYLSRETNPSPSFTDRNYRCN